MSKLEVGDVVRCVNPRTWPFLTNGETYIVSRVHALGGWVKLECQPPLLVAFYANGTPLIDWLPTDMFEVVR